MRRCHISYGNYLHLHDCEKNKIQPKIATQQEASDRINTEKQTSILSAKTEEKAIVDSKFGGSVFAETSTTF